MALTVEAWPLYHYRAKVARIVDGDTVEVDLDLGDRTYRTRRIRILGYDAPELFSGTNREAGARARDALALLMPQGTSIYLATRLDSESFNRLLAWAYVNDGSGQLQSVADAMIAEGFGG